MQPTKEHLSALMDDETGDLPASLRDGWTADSELKNTWSRYHLIGEVLREGELTPGWDSLEARVRDSLMTEPPLRQTATAHTFVPRRTWMKPALALAAGMGSLAVLGLFLASQPAFNPATQSQPFAMSDDAPAAGQTVDWQPDAPPALDARSAAAQELRRRLNSYMVNYNEQRDSFAVPNVHPYVRIVGYSNESPDR